MISWVQVSWCYIDFRVQSISQQKQHVFTLYKMELIFTIFSPKIVQQMRGECEQNISSQAA